MKPEAGPSGPASESSREASVSDSIRNSAQSTRRTTAHRGVPGLTMCPRSLPALRPLPHIVIPGNPRRRRSGASLPAAKEAAGARSAWSHSFPFCSPTTLIARRWTAGGGPEGRSSGKPLTLPAPVLVGAKTQRFPRAGRPHHNGRPGRPEPRDTPRQHQRPRQRQGQRQGQRPGQEQRPRRRTGASAPARHEAAVRSRCLRVPCVLGVQACDGSGSKLDEMPVFVLAFSHECRSSPPSSSRTHPRWGQVMV